jgi:hypothetical protein
MLVPIMNFSETKFAPRNSKRIAILVFILCCSGFSSAYSTQDSIASDVPFSGIEIVQDKVHLIAEGIDPLEIDLGQMQTGIDHFVRVKFKNMLDKSIRISDIKSNCGCVVAAKRTEIVSSKQTGVLFINIKAQFKESPISKIVTVTTDAGMSFQVFLKGSFVPKYKLVENRFELVDAQANRSIRVKLLMTGTQEPIHEISVESLTNFTSVLRLEADQAKPGEWDIELQLSESSSKLFHSSRELREDLLVRENGISVPACQVTLTIENGQVILCKPSTVTLTKSKATGMMEGEVMLFGKQENLKKSMAVVLMIDGVEHGRFPLVISTVSRNFCRATVTLPPNQHWAGLSILGSIRADGIDVGAIDKILFPKE